MRRVLLCASAALLAACSGCSKNDERNGGAHDAGSDAASGGASGGGGGTSGTGAGGSGGSGLADGGVAPLWGPPVGVVGCTFERLQNPAEVRAFTWAPCADTAGCERAVFDPAFWVEDGGDWVESHLGPSTSIHDDGEATRAVLVVQRHQAPVIVLVTDREGRTLDGYRESNDGTCMLTCAGISGPRLGIMVERQTGDIEADFGLLLGQVAQAGAPKILQLAKPPLGGPQLCPMGETRWAYWWVPGDRIVTIDNATGSDLKVVATAQINGPVWEMGFPVSAGKHFLFERTVSSPTGTHREIMITDGVAEPQPLLVPPAGSDYAGAAYANSHVVWARGSTFDAGTGYAKVEIWASPFATEAAKLAPEKLTDSHPGGIAFPWPAGWGHYGELLDGATFRIWDLASKQSVKRSFPNAITVWRTFGMTKTHLWTGGREGKNNKGDHLLRFTVE